MSTSLTVRTLDDLLTPLFPAAVRGWGQWAWLAKKFCVSRASVRGWVAQGHVPPLKVDAVCDLLLAPPDVRAELRRRAGFQVLPAQMEPGGAQGEV